MAESTIPLSAVIDSTSTVPAEALRAIEESKRADDARAEKVREANQKLEQERQTLQKIVYDNANPSPILVAVIVLTIIFIIWFVWVIFLKPCASGEWYDNLGNVFHIHHNTLTGVVKVKENGKPAGRAKVIDNFVRFGDMVGVWDYTDSIIYMDGMQWNRVVG
jgi:hypothetical protein